MDRCGLDVAPELVAFVEGEALPGAGVEPERFWSGLAAIFTRFAPENRALLAERDRLQAEIDAWWEARRGRPLDPGEQERFLRGIGYLVPEPESFTIDPPDVDEEVARTAGPQLVVPVLNTRFLLNAANARWGSLYDALYGTDAIPGAAAGPGYDRERGRAVIAWARAFLDDALPLAQGSWADWAGAGDPPLADPSLLVGRRGGGLLFRRHGLHIEVVIDREHAIGRDDAAGIADVVLESAVTTIVDFEDSVAAVDAEDKVAGYRNWLGVIRGDLAAEFEKNGRTVLRTLVPDREYTGLDDAPFNLPGRSLLFARTVGHLMTTPAVRLPDGTEAPEGVLDAAVVSLCALHDLRRAGRYVNSRAGSVYLVKPKMHGPEEVAFTDRLFDAVEDLLGLGRHVLKVGVMDEERRTSANLAACIAAVRHRIVFINTGFLDRTGDEIHTAMRAGPMVRKGEIKGTPWIAAYEDRNVQIGLACGLGGRAQIGKGMWAAPDRMADMLQQKIAHPQAGASTAWTPSPTAATLHATHYHRVDVAARQVERAREPVAPLAALLTPPLAAGRNWSAEEIAREVDGNVQSLLGYVVRWVDQGVGCSKVPDLDDIGLMEDRATLRISAQHLGNWLMHGVIDEAVIDAALSRMAAVVDSQNSGDPAYEAMTSGPRTSVALAAAKALIFNAADQPSGYTEPLLHTFRSQVKRRAREQGCSFWYPDA